MPSQDRTELIVATFQEAFGEAVEVAPKAMRGKYRKMARTQFAFYRGSAPLYYHDQAERADSDPYANAETSRVWIQGDLHAENYGTYMDSAGRLVFDVNDYDESYIGHFTWDVLRMGASLHLLGIELALADEEIEELIATYASSYAKQVESFATTDEDRDFGLRLGNTEGPLHDVLQSARSGSRMSLLEANTVKSGYDRVFREEAGYRQLKAAERKRVLAAFDEYTQTIPAAKREDPIQYIVKDVVGRSGFGIGSAGLPAYNLLLQGESEALEDDVILSMKQANIAAPSRVVQDARISSYFEHHGHRTAISQRALQAYADPWLGYTELEGRGQVVAALSPYETDLDWSGIDPSDMAGILTQLGMATAKVHCVADSSADQTLVPFVTEEAIHEVIESQGGVQAFAEHIVEESISYGEQARGDHALFVDAFRNGAFGV